jgi:histone acetyltransferase (RNA polymerase elongator complex component)
MKKRHYNIPVFIPELACPFQCIYCNQQKISGRLKIPSDEEIVKTINDHLSTIPEEDSEVELAFFGGNFTGIDVEDRRRLLGLVQPYLKAGSIGGIRLSTRPDYIDEDILKMLKDFGVKTVEIGAQSMDDNVLRLSKRGHTSKDTEKAAGMILKEGFSLGLQMMIGLPGDTPESAKFTAKRIIELGADNTRIYPTLVIRDTVLERMFRDGRFKPLSLSEAVGWSKELLLMFEKAGVKVIKLGLHPSEGLLSGDELIAGPFHQSFRELVLTEIWSDILRPLIDSDMKAQSTKHKTQINSKYQNPKSKGQNSKHKTQGEKHKNENELDYSEEIEIHVPVDQFNYAVGYRGKNKKMLSGRFSNVKFVRDKVLSGRDFKIVNLR